MGSRVFLRHGKGDDEEEFTGPHAERRATSLQIMVVAKASERVASSCTVRAIIVRRLQTQGSTLMCRRPSVGGAFLLWFSGPRLSGCRTVGHVWGQSQTARKRASWPTQTCLQLRDRANPSPENVGTCMLLKRLKRYDKLSRRIPKASA